MADLVYEGITPCTELQVTTATAHPVPKSQTITGIGHWDLLLNSVRRSKEQNDQGKYGKLAFAKGHESWSQAELQSITDKTVTNQAFVCTALSVYVPMIQHCGCRRPKPEKPGLFFSCFSCVGLFLPLSSWL